MVGKNESVTAIIVQGNHYFVGEVYILACRGYRVWKWYEMHDTVLLGSLYTMPYLNQSCWRAVVSFTPFSNDFNAVIM